MLTRQQICDKYPEEFHRLINNALDWLDENEPKWKLDKPCNRYKYVKQLMRSYRKEKHDSTPTDQAAHGSS